MVKKRNTLNKNRGFAAFVIVLIMGAATLIIAVFATLLSIGESEMSVTARQGTEAFYLTDGCMEEVFRQIRLDSNYGVGAGIITISLPPGSCTIEVTDLGSNQRGIITTGSSNNYTQKIASTITVTSNVISINDWQLRDD